MCLVHIATHLYMNKKRKIIRCRDGKPKSNTNKGGYQSEGKYTKLYLFTLQLHFSVKRCRDEALFIYLHFYQGPLFIVLYSRPPSSAPAFDDLEGALVPLTPSKLKSCILLEGWHVNTSQQVLWVLENSDGDGDHICVYMTSSTPKNY